jgi:dTDP-4-dehydrorhamnose 3,5-epimerase
MPIDSTISGVICTELKVMSDYRGWLVELFRTDEIESGRLPAMAYLSMTHPGVTRGPHEHRNQTDHFAFVGPSTFRLHLWDNRVNSPTYRAYQSFDVGQYKPMAIEVPCGVVHAYQNIGQVDGLVYNFPDHLYRGARRSDEVDEIRYEDDPNSPFVIKD